MRRRQPLTTLAVGAALALTACSTPPSSATGPPTTSAAGPTSAAATIGSTAGATSSAATTAVVCSRGALKTKKAGFLTVATDSPARDPWFVGNQPANGKGFESAVAFAVAAQLGYPSAKVRWVHAKFDSVIAGTPKTYDFDINQVSITAARKKSVDFSPGYYDVAQAIIALKTDKFASAKDLAGLHGARIGAQAGRPSVDAVKNQVKPHIAVREYPTSHLAVQALLNGQIDALAVDLPTALHFTAVVLANTTIIGQLPVTGSPEQFGLVLSKNSPLTKCVSSAVTALDHAGILVQLEQTWLTTSAGAPVLY